MDCYFNKGKRGGKQMSKLMDFLLCGAVTMFELIGVIILGMLVQLIMYQVFGINIYKSLIRASRKLDKYLNEKF